MRHPGATGSTLAVQWLGINAIRFTYRDCVVLLERGLVPQPYCDLEGFAQSMQHLAPGIPVQTLGLMETIHLS